MARVYVDVASSIFDLSDLVETLDHYEYKIVGSANSKLTGTVRLIVEDDRIPENLNLMCCSVRKETQPSGRYYENWKGVSVEAKDIAIRFEQCVG